MNSASLAIRSSVRRGESGVSRKIIFLFAILLLGLFLCPDALRTDETYDTPNEGFETVKAKAEQGDAEAQLNLGYCYTNGIGVPLDMEEAVKWYRMSAEQGNAEAQLNLGECYANGDGVLQDKEEAVKWYRMSGEQGNTLAQWRLGKCYANGDGVRQDKEEAVKWLCKAVERG